MQPMPNILVTSNTRVRIFCFGIPPLGRRPILAYIQPRPSRRQRKPREGSARPNPAWGHTCGVRQSCLNVCICANVSSYNTHATSPTERSVPLNLAYECEAEETSPNLRLQGVQGRQASFPRMHDFQRKQGRHTPFTGRLRPILRALESADLSHSCTRHTPRTFSLMNPRLICVSHSTQCRLISALKDAPMSTVCL
jgi:hypothetical protein